MSKESNSDMTTGVPSDDALKTSKLQKLIEYARSLICSGFYGKLTITFSGGRIVHIEKQESLKL